MINFDKLFFGKTLPSCWKDYYESVLPLMKNENCLKFLQESHIQKAKEFFNIKIEYFQILCDAAEYIRSNADLLEIFAFWYHLLFSVKDTNSLAPYSWVLPNGIPEPYQVMFPVLVVLAGLDIRLQIEQQRNIPPEISIATREIISITLERFYKPTGLSTEGTKILGWHYAYIHGDFHWIGALEFENIKFTGNQKLFCNKITGEKCILMGAGHSIRRDGLINGSNNLTDCNAETTRFVELESCWKGRPVNEYGTVIPEMRKLLKSEWDCVVKQGDSVINVHIPPGAKINPDSFKKSRLMALDFFRNHFPEKKYTAFVCFSWLMDPQLQLFLEENSNICSFQKTFHLFPMISNGSAMLEFLFTKPPVHYSELEGSSSLQKKIIHYMAIGGEMRTAGGIIPI